MRPVVPRLVIAVLLSLFAVAAVAAAQGTAPTLKIAHDGSRDITSGGYTGDPDGASDPLAARPPNSYETFEVDVPEELWSELRVEGLLREDAPTPRMRTNTVGGN